MNAAADILDREAEQIGAMLTAEMGKTLKSAGAEARRRAGSTPRTRGSS